MSDKPTGVFVRLPLSDEMVDKAQVAYCSELTSGDKACLTNELLAIGTPVMASDIPVITNLLGPEWEIIPVVRQSDAQAQIAALEAEVVRLRHYLERIDSLIMGNSDPVMMFCGIHASRTEALKGGAA